MLLKYLLALPSTLVSGGQNHAMWVPVNLPTHVGDAATFENEGFDLIQHRTLFMQVHVLCGHCDRRFHGGLSSERIR